MLHYTRIKFNQQNDNDEGKTEKEEEEAEYYIQDTVE